MKKKVKYNADYFIKLFSKIPVDKIGKESLSNKCALYHVGVRNYKKTRRAEALSNLIGDFSGRSSWDTRVYIVNDDAENNYGLGTTPKERILVALEIVKGAGL